MLKLKRLRLENRKGASQNVAPLSQLSEKVQNVNSTFLVVFIFHGRWETQGVKKTELQVCMILVFSVFKVRTKRMILLKHGFSVPNVSPAALRKDDFSEPWF